MHIDLDSVEVIDDSCGLIYLSGIKVSEAVNSKLSVKIKGKESSIIEFTRPITKDTQTETVSFNSFDVDSATIDFVVSVVNDDGDHIKGELQLEKGASMKVKGDVSSDHSEAYYGSFRFRFIVASIAGLVALTMTHLEGWKGGLFAIFCSIIAGLFTGMVGDATELF